MAFISPQLSKPPDDPTRYRAACNRCGLYKGCRSPKMPVTGKGRKGILVVAEAPGEVEDELNTQLVGPAGEVARKAFWDAGIDLDLDCWKTNALICRPPENRTPTLDEIEYCRPNLLFAIDELQPKIIVLMGKSAVNSLLRVAFREDLGVLDRWVGWKIPSQKFNSWILPTYHPSYVRRQRDQRDGPLIDLWFRRHIDAINYLPAGRPWEDEIPDYELEVEVIYDIPLVRMLLYGWRAEGGAIAFDYETNRLKPDSTDSEIVSCAVCYKGERTIAYPFIGDAVKATADLLKSNNPKIGANNKFETRWTEKILNVPVRNWVWDTMLSAHHLDCRRGITSVKFQAFVRLGQEPWDEHINPFLKSADETGKNRIRELDLHSLLVYNGMDALIEYKLAGLQRKEMRSVRHEWE